MFNYHLARFNLVLYEILPRVDVLGLLCAELFSIFLQQYRDHVILVEYVLSNAITLCLQELPTPYHLYHCIVRPDEFRLRLDLGLQLLLLWYANY